MRLIHGCPEIFRVSLTTPTATIPNILMGFCSDRPYECSYKILKSAALPVPEIIGVPKNWAVPGYAQAPFSKKNNGLLFGLVL